MTYEEVSYGNARVLLGPDRGAYPYANSVLIRGAESSALIDPSRALLDQRPDTDLILVSHAHEDHTVGLADYPAPVACHVDDLPIVQDPELMIAAIPTTGANLDALREQVLTDFRVSPRPDATGFTDGSTFDLGGVTVTVVHLPGHTRGHCGFMVEPGGFFFVGDIDLSGIGPYYGGLDSDLVDFEESLEVCGEVDARWYATAHQKGVIEGPADFRARLRTYAAVIDRRDTELLEALTKPRTLDEIVANPRLVYRSHVEGPHVEPVERRTASLHLDRLVAAGQVRRVGERYLGRQ